MQLSCRPDRARWWACHAAQVSGVVGSVKATLDASHRDVVSFALFADGACSKALPPAAPRTLKVRHPPTLDPRSDSTRINSARSDPNPFSGYSAPSAPTSLGAVPGAALTGRDGLCGASAGAAECLHCVVMGRNVQVMDEPREP